MKIIRSIMFSILALFMLGTSANAQAQPSLTKEQQQALAELKKEYQAYEQQHQKEFMKAKELEQQFIQKNKKQFDKIIMLNKQFKKEQQDKINKLLEAQKKFQQTHPEANFHLKEMSAGEEYHHIYMGLLHKDHHSKPHKMPVHHNGKQTHELHKQFIEENKELITQIKKARIKFEQAHKEDWDKLQTSFHSYYKEHEADLLKVQTLKQKFIEEHQEQISKLGPAAVLFFHEMKFGRSLH